jgi:hypothetical protein
MAALNFCTGTCTASLGKCYRTTPSTGELAVA